MENKNDISISGSGKVIGGSYGNIRISGAGRISGDVTADSLHVSGSCHAEGLDVGEIRASGSLRAEGPVKGNELHISGSAHTGSCEVGEVRVSGSLHAEGKITAVTLSVSGGMNAGGDVEAETVKISGGVKIGGLLNADKVDIRLGGKCSIAEIGGETITVREGDGNLSFSIMRLFGKKTGAMLEVNTIEGTNISLENTVCNIVRGKNVVIGKGCEIGRIEYEETLSVSDDSKAEKTIKI